MRDESPEMFFERGFFKTEYIRPGNDEGDATLVLLKDPDDLVATIKLVAEAFRSQLDASKRAIETAREALEKTKREE